jgi:hypothetical protein
LRFGDFRRGKGKRGGLRVTYYYWIGGPEFWLFTLFDKDEMADLAPKQRVALKERVKSRKAPLITPGALQESSVPWSISSTMS